MKKEGEEIERS